MTDTHAATWNSSELRLVVEKLRLMGYTGFCVVVLTGILLTRAFSDVVLEKSLLVQVFGYNNICVYFDSPPSTYVLPVLWAFTLVLLLVYISVHWLHMRAEVQAGTLTPGLYKVLSAAKAFEAVTMISFTTIFAVNPNPDFTLAIHTAPFFLLQIGMVSLAMSNTLHGIKSGYWQRLDLPPWFAKAAIVYCIIFAMVVAFKIPVATNAMVVFFMTEGFTVTVDLSQSIWWSQTPFLKSVAMVVDKLFVVCAVVVPMAKAAYLLRYRSDEIDVVVLRPSISSKLTAPTEQEPELADVT